MNYTRMEIVTQVNFIKENSTVKASTNGPVEIIMREIGTKVINMAKDYGNQLLEISTWAIGGIASAMGTEYRLLIKETNMRENGVLQ